MTPEQSFAPVIESLIGQQVVVDTKGPFLYIGTLEKLTGNALLLAEVDVHHTGESSTSNDLYLVETARHGVRASRRSVYVLSKEIVSISPLSAIIRY